MAEAPAAAGESVAVETLATSASTSTDSPATTTEAVTAAPASAKPGEDSTQETDAAAVEAARVAALTPEQRQAEADEKAKADAEAKAKAEADAKAKQVPEKYEFKAPEGVTLDSEVTTAFEAKAKALGLSQDAAQELFELGAQAVQKQVAGTQAQIQKLQGDWLAASKSDKEFGGENLAANLAVAKNAMRFATPELKDLLNTSKLGDHPELVRWMYRVGKALTPEGHVTGSAPVPAKSLSQRMYPNQPQ